MPSGKRKSGKENVLIAAKIMKIGKKYGKLDALINLNFEIEAGEIFALLGPNGAGKTTTIKILTTLQKPTSGNAEIFGNSILNEAGIKAIRGIITSNPQGNSLDPFLSVWDNLRFYARLQKLKRGSWEPLAEEYLSILDLADKRNSSVWSLSGGQFRRLQCCRAILAKKRLLFLDEPTLGIDVTGKIRVWDLIKRFQSGVHCTIVLSTNDMAEAEYLADRIGFLYKGSIMDIGTANELKTKTNNGKVRISFAEQVERDFTNHKQYRIEMQDHLTMLLNLCEFRGDVGSAVKFAAQFGSISDIDVKKTTLTEVFKEAYKG
jgi:ABC-2 type transport system ATP-binding protein